IQQRILVIRGKRVLLDADLARFYGVATFNLNKAVSRNPSRFPEDFAFQLSREEHRNLIFQSGISSAQSTEETTDKEIQAKHGGSRKLPRVFTEQGIAMLASVLRSQRAVAMSVAIVRAFVQLREMLAGQRQLAGKLAELEQRLEGHDEAIGNLFEAIRQLIEPSAPEHTRKIGFDHAND
ncbi:MAG: ORF6N domain-containing protein, partial [Lacunisphaera sp.]